MTQIIATFLDWLNLLVHLFGLAVCVWAYRLCRKPGYLVVAAYYLLAFCGLVIGPMIKRALSNRSRGEAKPQEISASVPSAAELKLNFPLGPLILVSGLWLLARRESPESNEPSANQTR